MRDDDDVSNEEKIDDILRAIELITDYIKNMQSTLDSLDDRLTEVEELIDSGEVIIDSDFDLDPAS